MKTLSGYRLQEWLADRVRWVQYPKRTVREPAGVRWKYSMPWDMRLGMGLISLFVVIIASGVLCGMLFIGWTIVRELFR